MQPSAIIIAALTLGLGVGCGPSQEELEAEQARVRELQEQLRSANADRESLNERLGTVRAQNEEMANRLRALGEDVEQLQGDREGLERSLTETQQALAELRERERQAQARLQTFQQMIERFRSMIEAGQLRVRIRGNRMVVELPEGILFDSARARIKTEGETTLTDVAQVLQTIENRDFQVAGHTDNIPIRSRRFPSNWELSTARAVNVARYLIEQGVPGERLSAAGYAETEPVASNDDDAGRAQNRRIEIVLVPNLDELPDLSSLENIE
ncbi:MAG: OmpA family protein [Myxococcota bacterium]